MLVKMLETQKFGKRSYRKGTFADVDEVQAAEWIKTKQAVRASEEEFQAAQQQAEKSEDPDPKKPAETDPKKPAGKPAAK